MCRVALFAVQMRQHDSVLLPPETDKAALIKQLDALHVDEQSHLL